MRKSVRLVSLQLSLHWNWYSCTHPGVTLFLVVSLPCDGRTGQDTLNSWIHYSTTLSVHWHWIITICLWGVGEIPTTKQNKADSRKFWTESCQWFWDANGLSKASMAGKEIGDKDNVVLVEPDIIDNWTREGGHVQVGVVPNDTQKMSFRIFSFLPIHSLSSSTFSLTG